VREAEVAEALVTAVHVSAGRAVVEGVAYSWKRPDAAHGVLSQAIYKHLHARIPKAGATSAPMSLPKRGDLTDLLTGVAPHRVSAYPATWADEAPGHAAMSRCTRVSIRLETGLVLHVRPGLVSSRPDGPDGELRVMLPSVLPSASPGFAMVAGPDARLIRPPVVRIYINARAECAPAVLGQVLHLLSSTTRRYIVKALNESRHYPRADSLVMYVRPQDYEQLRAPLRGVFASHAMAWVLPDVSLFAQPLAPGVAVALETSEIRAKRKSFGLELSERAAACLLDNSRSSRPALLAALTSTLARPLAARAPGNG
jgi:hypothetical protein